MTRIRLRNASLLGLRWLWRNPQHSLPLALLALYFGVWLMVPKQKPRVSSAPTFPIARDAALLPPAAQVKSKAKKKPSKDKREDIFTLREGRNVWRVETWSHNPAEDADYNDYVAEFEQSVRFYRNGLLALTVPASDLRGPYIEARQAVLPVSFPVIAVRAHGYCSRGRVLRLYALRNGKLTEIAEFSGVNGGPVFRDYDGDGRPEWVFDDFNGYRFPDRSPEHYLIYKLQPDGSLKLWKRLPNRKRLPLRHIYREEDEYNHAPE